MNVCCGSRVSSNIFEKQFWFREVEALRVDEFRIQKLLLLSHFEEAVDDEDKFRENWREKVGQGHYSDLCHGFSY
jgi:hypothetical protein